MKNNILFKIKTLLEKIEDVKMILYLNQRGIRYSYSDSLGYNELLIVFSNFKKLNNINKMIENQERVFLFRKNNLDNYENKLIENSLVFDDGKIYNIKYIKMEDFYEYIKNIKSFEIILDRENNLYGFDASKNYESKFIEIKKEEFTDYCIDYFINQIKAVKIYEDGDKIKAKILQNKLFDNLINLINNYLLFKYDRKIELDTYGKGYINYLDVEYYDELESIISLDMEKNFWTVIFKSLQLFRQIGLKICEIKQYEYPKKEDVEVLKLLREIYSDELGDR